MRILFVVYDNESYIPHFPIGLAQLTSVLEKNGHSVEFFLQDVHHLPAHALTELLDNEHFDMAGLSFIGGYWQYRKAQELSRAINASKNRPFYCIGGHGPAPEPEYFMRLTGADAVCIGEGDETILDICRAVAGEISLADVKGIAWRRSSDRKPRAKADGGEFAVNERRPLIQDIDALPLPAYHRFPINVYRLLRMPNCTTTDFCIPMLSGRGCTFRCNFCYRMDKGFRPRSNEAIIEEMRLLHKDYGITYIAFYDELLMSSVERTVSLCNDILKSGLPLKWDCNGRLNYAKPDVLRLMKQAGCVFINYGIECFDDNVLKNMHKGLTTKQITRGIEATLSAGISPGLNIIFGNHGENRRTLMQGVDFLLKYDDGAQLRTIRPVTPYPGTELYYDAIRCGKLKDCDDFYRNKHTNSDLMAINFTELTDNEYYDCLYEANAILLDNYNKRVLQRNRDTLTSLYKNHDPSFRGFRHF